MQMSIRSVHCFALLGVPLTGQCSNVATQWMVHTSAAFPSHPSPSWITRRRRVWPLVEINSRQGGLGSAGGVWFSCHPGVGNFLCCFDERTCGCDMSEMQTVLHSDRHSQLLHDRALFVVGWREVDKSRCNCNPKCDGLFCRCMLRLLFRKRTVCS